MSGLRVTVPGPQTDDEEGIRWESHETSAWAEASCVAGFPKEVTANSGGMGWGVGRRGGKEAWFSEDRVRFADWLAEKCGFKIICPCRCFHHISRPLFSARPGSQQSTGFAVVLLGFGMILSESSSWSDTP